MNLLSKEAVMFIYNNCRTEGSRNETIIDTLIVNCGKLKNFVYMCDALERLSTEPAMKEVVDAFKNGKKYKHYYNALWLFVNLCQCIKEFATLVR